MSRESCRAFMTMLNGPMTRGLAKRMREEGQTGTQKYMFKHLETCPVHGELETYENVNSCVRYEFMAWVDLRILALQMDFNRDKAAFFQNPFAQKWFPSIRQMILDRIHHAKGCDEHREDVAGLEEDLQFYDEVASTFPGGPPQGNQ